MEQSTEPVVVGVRFSKVGKVYHFSANDLVDVKVGDRVVVETSRGWQLGQVAQIVANAEPPPEGWKPIDRRATPRDLLLRQMWQMKEAEVVSSCRAKAVELKLSGIKIVAAEYSFDGSRLTIHFSSETEEKYDLKSLRQDMQKMFAPSQVEMRQIGPRDVAKTVCGMGACGLETRCCCLFLTEFSSISIRMAKEQGVSLTPTEITGMCGRLRCCLIYEYDTYVDARSKLPKRNKRVRTPQGEGKVVDVVPLREAVIVELPEIGRREFPGSEVQLVEDGGQQAGGRQQSEPEPEEPFTGTQQPSAMDQAIVEEAIPEEFTISPEGEPKEHQAWDFPPPLEQAPADKPEGETPSRRSRRGDRRGKRGGRAKGSRPAEGQSKGEQPGHEQQGDKPGETPGDKPKGGRPSGKRGSRRGGKLRSQGGQSAENQQGKPKDAANNNTSTNANESRRRRGRRRDSRNGEN